MIGQTLQAKVHDLSNQFAKLAREVSRLRRVVDDALASPHARTAHLTPMEKTVLNFVRENPGLMAVEIADLLDMPQALVFRRVANLRKHGLVETRRAAHHTGPGRVPCQLFAAGPDAGRGES